MFTSIIPPDMPLAKACAIELSGVTQIPVVVAPLATVGRTTVMTSEDPIVIVVPVASSM